MVKVTENKQTKKKIEMFLKHNVILDTQSRGKHAFQIFMRSRNLQR